MILGVDFDNTLACYDGIFHAEALKLGLLPEGIPTHKSGVRDYLRSVGREPAFTELQGHVYGPGITAAMPYSGALECLRELLARGATIYIVSHKTRHPVIGPRHDLHQAARLWLEEKGLHAPDMLPRENVFFEETREAKLARIGTLGCTHFVDDLPELLAEPEFPHRTEGLLFAPPTEDGELKTHEGTRHFASWSELQGYLLEHRYSYGY